MSKHRSWSERLWDWLLTRTKFEPLVTSRVPRHALNPVYCLGGMTFLFFVVLAVTGILLAIYYSPTPENAFDSIEVITKSVPFGWLVRSVHFYSANAMLILAVLHMLRVYFMGAYRAPRELNWMVGALLGSLTVFAGYTGYVLRWDQQAVGASGIGQGIAMSIPYFGSFVASLFWGRVYADTLSRYFVAHLLLIPGLMIVLVALHFWMVKRHGISDPL